MTSQTKLAEFVRYRRVKVVSPNEWSSHLDTIRGRCVCARHNLPIFGQFSPDISNGWVQLYPTVLRVPVALSWDSYGRVPLPTRLRSLAQPVGQLYSRLYSHTRQRKNTIVIYGWISYRSQFISSLDNYLDNHPQIEIQPTAPPTEQ